MKRNPAIELYRILAMLGICILHGSIVNGHSPRAWWINLWPWCVNAFVFISGYFGCSFKPSKIIRLYGTALFASFSVLLVNQLWRGTFDPPVCFACVWPMIKGFWFLHAYVFLMALAPCVDVAAKMGGGKILLPICLIVFGWSFAQTLPIIGPFVPKTPGLECYSGMSLLATYVVARLYRLKDCEHRWRPGWVATAFVALLILSSVGLCEYDSPIVAALACCGFYLISRITLNERLGKIVSYVSPSMFAIYIISVGGGWGVIEYFVFGLERQSIILAAVIAGVAVFAFSLVVDLPRRLICLLLAKPIDRVSNAVDVLYSRVVDGMGLYVFGRHNETVCH